LPRYTDGQPDGWRIFRLGLCHECGGTIVPDEMGKSNKELCSGACRAARSRADRSCGDWSLAALEIIEELECVRSVWAAEAFSLPKPPRNRPICA
ncbi:MAG TPA: hypothetical protein VHB53_09600, partial [Solirubrobacterales bacterium]|nr:hypothetical protein [Solirubrobacterales bacterium]